MLTNLVTNRQNKYCMIIKDFSKIQEFIAGDKIKFRELLHPDKENL